MYISTLETTVSSLNQLLIYSTDTLNHEEERSSQARAVFIGGAPSE